MSGKQMRKTIASSYIIVHCPCLSLLFIQMQSTFFFSQNLVQQSYIFIAQLSLFSFLP